ncbi:MULTISPECIES: MBL fold metallo-hydrolase [Acinetobacter]|uniref:MBL fold metallo-hydrolase n=1 Tax=Acinetobacter piscicola TaxID=2006115 RepID=A0A7S7AH95_9GAMM|nr:MULTISPECIES: MBL fold metallo-hydrolase [Acinetobacter]QOW46205.1 MBL fold metallo-hydrolase [Acinetobacter piscicola]
MQNIVIQDFFDENTNTFSYVVSDPITSQCAIIDSVLDYDSASASTTTTHADFIIAYVQANDLKVQWILETHVHADHLTASQYLKEKLGGQVAMSEKISEVQKTFADIYHFENTAHFNVAFDYLFEAGEKFKIGQLEAYSIATPGHTPACLSYVIEDCVFVGDTLFMHDYGTARCDFPKGSASQLYDSIQKIFALPEHFRIFLCHDYLPKTRTEYQCQSTVKAQKLKNIHVHIGIEKADFVQMREQRDATLSMPKLILPAIQINMVAGHFPKAESNGIRYLKIPFNYFKS